MIFIYFLIIFVLGREGKFLFYGIVLRFFRFRFEWLIFGFELASNFIGNKYCEMGSGGGGFLNRK